MLGDILQGEIGAFGAQALGQDEIGIPWVRRSPRQTPRGQQRRIDENKGLQGKHPSKKIMN